MCKFARTLVLFLLVFFTNIVGAQAGVIFALRGDNLAPRYARGGKAYSPFVAAVNLGTPPAVITASSISATGTKGSSLIDVHHTNSDERAIKYLAGANWVTGTNVFTIRYSFVPNWSGIPANDKNLFLIGHNANSFNGGIRVQIYDNGKVNVAMTAGDGVGSAMLSAATTASAITIVNKQKMEIQVACDGTRVYLSVDGVAAGDWPLTVTDRYMNGVLAGNIYLGVYSVDSYIDEFLIFDTFEAQTYTPSSSYLAVDDVDATVSSDPGVGNVLVGTNYTIAGVAKTGTYNTADLFTDIGENDVLQGTSWAYNSLTNNRSGNYVAPDSTEVKDGVSFGVGANGELYCQDPGVSNVSAGVEYFIYSDDFVGTRQTVTNVLSSQTITGASTSGVLVAR